MDCCFGLGHVFGVFSWEPEGGVNEIVGNEINVDVIDGVVIVVGCYTSERKVFAFVDDGDLILDARYCGMFRGVDPFAGY